MMVCDVWFNQPSITFSIDRFTQHAAQHGTKCDGLPGYVLRSFVRVATSKCHFVTHFCHRAAGEGLTVSERYFRCCCCRRAREGRRRETKTKPRRFETITTDVLGHRPWTKGKSVLVIFSSLKQLDRCPKKHISGIGYTLFRYLSYYSIPACPSKPVIRSKSSSVRFWHGFQSSKEK